MADAAAVLERAAAGELALSHALLASADSQPAERATGADAAADQHAGRACVRAHLLSNILHGRASGGAQQHDAASFVPRFAVAAAPAGAAQPAGAARAGAATPPHFYRRLDAAATAAALSAASPLARSIYSAALAGGEAGCSREELASAAAGEGAAVRSALGALEQASLLVEVGFLGRRLVAQEAAGCWLVTPFALQAAEEGAASAASPAEEAARGGSATWAHSRARVCCL